MVDGKADMDIAAECGTSLFDGLQSGNGRPSFRANPSIATAGS
jgi:hypothetical protein